MELIRLSKLIAQRGLASRREAEALIEKGYVKVDGQVVQTQGVKVPEGADVEISREGQKVLQSQVTLILNKPVGYVSNLPEKGYRPAIELITKANQFGKGPVPSRTKLAVCGRLDIDSKGLLIFTQNGVLAKKIIGADTSIDKEYVVQVSGQITQGKLEKLRLGLSLDGKALKRAEIRQPSSHRLIFVLREGKKRQIRRMCDLVGLKVQSLKRVRVGPIQLDTLPSGKWRLLSSAEIDSLSSFS